jgi:hypothetical protein
MDKDTFSIQPIERPSQPRNGQRRGPQQPRLEIVAESPKPDAHLLFMKEFLAPLLAKEFLRQRQVAIPATRFEVSPHVSTIEPSSRRDGR